MRETLVHHLSEDEMVLEGRTQLPAEDVLESRPVKQEVVYPVIETWLTGHANGSLGHPQPTPQARVWHKFVPGCWHELFSASDHELAGMGLAIIGNLCKAVSDKRLSTDADAKLVLRLASYADDIKLPWPGFSNDRQITLDLCQLPMDVAMFLHDEDGQFKKRIDRLELMRNIENTFVPHLKALLEARL